MNVELQAFLTLALDGGEWSVSHPGRFTPREIARRRELKPGRPAHTLVSIMAELFWLLCYV